MNMTSLAMSTLDFQRLQERISRSKADPATPYQQVISLLKKMEGASLYEPATMPANVVTMHSRVKLDYLDSSKTLAIQLVYPEEMNPTQNRISIFAPLATAILGCREKDMVRLTTPYGSVRVCIDRILYQPEAAGDLTL